MACQSGDEKTRGRLNVPGKLGNLKPSLTVEVAGANLVFFSFS